MVRRSTWKPVSLVELSVQVRSISLVDTAVACRLDGALTGPPPPPPESSSWMVSVELLRAASREAPPVELERLSRIVSLGSGLVSLTIATVKDLSELSLSPQERVPVTEV